MEKMDDQFIEKRIEENKYGDYLYHYTSTAVLYSMLKNKQFWFGNTATMNDRKEVKHFLNLLREALSFDIHADKVNQYNEYFEKAFAHANNEYPYAMCFSRLDDDAAQWERYADDGRGICIVFRTREMMRVVIDELVFGNVYYDFDIRQHQHYKILHDYFSSGKLNEFSSVEGQMENVIVCGYFRKHRSFRSEQEIRVASLYGDPPKHTIVETECVGGVIKKYMKFNMEKRCEEFGLSFEDLFEEIVIGPKSAQDIGSLQTFIEEAGFKKLKNKVRKSDCPLR